METKRSASRAWTDTLEVGLTAYAVAIFAILWIGFLALLLVNSGGLDELWKWVRDLPWPVAVTVWILFLPITVGLWIWESDWSSAARWAGFAGIVAWTALAFSGIPKLFGKS